MLLVSVVRNGQKFNEQTSQINSNNKPLAEVWQGKGNRGGMGYGCGRGQHGIAIKMHA